MLVARVIYEVQRANQATRINKDSLSELLIKIFTKPPNMITERYTFRRMVQQPHQLIRIILINSNSKLLNVDLVILRMKHAMTNLSLGSLTYQYANTYCEKNVALIKLQDFPTI